MNKNTIAEHSAKMVMAIINTLILGKPYDLAAKSFHDAFAAGGRIFDDDESIVKALAKMPRRACVGSSIGGRVGVKTARAYLWTARGVVLCKAGFVKLYEQGKAE